MNKKRMFALLKQYAPDRIGNRSIDDFTDGELAGLMAEMQHRHGVVMESREAPIGTYDAKARTADVVWSTGARVKRYDWSRDIYYMEELSMDPAHVRMGRLQNGAPLLNTHSRYSLSDVIGVVDTATITAGRGTATVRLSSRADVAPIAQDVEDKIIRAISVGYAVYRIEQLPADAKSEGLPIYRATDWEPQELSFVPIGADPEAGTRSAETKTFSCEFISSGTTEVAPTRGTAPNTARKEPLMSKEQMYGLIQRLAPKKLGGKALGDFTEEDLQRMVAALDVKDVESDETRAAAAAAAAALANPAPGATVTADQAVAADRARSKAINDLVRQHKLDDALGLRLVDSGVSLDAARLQILEAIAARSAAAPVATGGHVDLVTDETVQRRSHMMVAVLHRSSPDAIKLDDGSRQYAHMTLREMARKCLELRGIKTDGMSVTEIAKRSFESTSDFPAILIDAANKSLRDQYEVTPRTFTTWAKMGTAPDFKNINRVQLSGAPSLLSVMPGAEYKRGAVTDGKETYQLATFGRIIGINRQAIINDDLSAFTRLPILLARAAADMQSDTVYAVLTGNAALGVDGVALFHATHKNLTGSGTAISVTSLGVARAAMRVQTGIEGRPINIGLKTLLVPAAQETLAQQFTSSAYIANQSNAVNPFVNTQVVCEPRLDANSTTAWYGMADPAQCDTVEYSFLEGQEGVYLESRYGFEVDGIELKARLDFAAKALDFRGMYKNAGA